MFLILTVAFPLLSRGQDDVFDITVTGVANHGYNDEVLHNFSAEDLSLIVSLRNAPLTPLSLSFQFIQLASDLSLPDKPRFLSQLSGSGKPYSYRITLPSVERTSDFEFRLISESGNASAGVFKKIIRIYPRSLLNPLKRWAEKNLLIVDDPEGSIRRLLQNRAVEFSPALERVGTEKTAVISILTGTSSANIDKLRTSLHGDGLIVVRRRETLFPRLVSVEKKGVRLVAIDESLLVDLQTNPRAQLALLEAFELALPDSKGGLPFEIPLASIVSENHEDQDQ